MSSKLMPAAVAVAETPRVRAEFRDGLALPLLAIWLLATLGLRPLSLPDEGRYAEVARAMLLGDPWVPKLNGVPFFHKPPLFYWLDAAAMQVFGIHEFAGRMGSAVGAWIMGAALWFATRRALGPRTASIALAVLATTPLFFIGGQYANHDMLVGGLITAAVFAFARAVDEPPRVDLRWLVAAWSLCGLALLSKGLIGVVLPALIIGPWLLLLGRWRQLVGLAHPVGVAALLIVAAPWCIAMQLRHPGFFDYFVVEQHFRRYVQTDFNNVRGFWFFLVVLPALTLPWSLWLPAALRDLRWRTDPLNTLCLCWIIAVVGFFSLPSSKLVGYVLPALAPWALLLARAVARGAAGGAADGRWRRPGRWALVAGFVCVGILVGSFGMKLGSNRDLALKLRELKDSRDRVVMVGEYEYDVPFYAQLASPVVIVENWDDPEIGRRDNWRKEMLDAARFDPALGRQLLRLPSEMDRLACGQSGVWFVVGTDKASAVAALTGVVGRVYQRSGKELWLVSGRAC